MSSFIIHLLIPVLVILSTGMFRIRDAWMWSWAAWAVDVDYLGWVLHVRYGWYNFHRALFHNVWLLVLGVALAWMVHRRWQRSGGGSFADFSRAKPGWVLVPFFYASHLMLDLFAGGVVAFWPASETTYFWDFQVDVDTREPVPRPQVVSDFGTVAGVPEVSKVYTWMTAEQFGIFLVYLLSVAVLFAKRQSQRWAWTRAPLRAPRRAPSLGRAPRGRAAPRRGRGRAL